MRRFVLMHWVIVILVGACYRAPSYEHCALACDPALDNPCPRGFDCKPSGAGFACHAEGEAACAEIDAGIEPIADAAGLGCIGKGMGVFISFCPSIHLPATFEIPASLGTNEIDTHTQCDTLFSQSGAPEQLCVKIAQTIVVSGPVRAKTTASGASRPLLLVGVDGIHVTATGTIDVSSTTDDPTRAAGEGFAMGGDATVAANLGGGAGGSFATLGGPGGPGNGGTQGFGVPTGAVTPTFLRGGSRGGAGAGAIAIARSGGAIYLLSGKDITIGGAVTAGGQGGTVGGPSGGSGGGSGGMIVLDAADNIIVESSARIIALGGGGGGGGDASADGMRGADAFFPTNAAAGGGGSTAGGNGGNGAGRTSAPEPGLLGDVGGGGGGGGGAAGYIYISPAATIPLANIAPMPRTN